jgi:hypothetical protein
MHVSISGAWVALFAVVLVVFVVVVAALVVAFRGLRKLN